jgi:hypothetical protein
MFDQIQLACFSSFSIGKLRSIVGIESDTYCYVMRTGKRIQMREKSSVFARIDLIIHRYCEEVRCLDRDYTRCT